MAGLPVRNPLGIVSSSSSWFQPEAAVTRPPARQHSSASRLKFAEAVPFAVTKEEAAHHYGQWIADHTPLPEAPPIRTIRSVLLPYWVFEAEIETRVDNTLYHRDLNGPSAQVYGGFRYPRKMLEVSKADMVNARAFKSSMLVGPDGHDDISVDPFEVFESTAFEIVRERVLDQEAEALKESHPERQIRVDFHDIVSRKVFFPAYVIEYEHSGQMHRLYVSGLTGLAHGIEQHSVVGAVMAGWSRLVSSPHTSTAGRVLRDVFADRRSGGAGAAILVGLVRLVGNVLVRVVMTPPFLVASLAGSFLYWRWLHSSASREHSKTYAEWDEERARMREEQASMTDEWLWRPEGETEADRQRRERRRGAGTGSWRFEHGRRQQAYEREAERQQARPAASGGRKPRPVRADDYYGLLGLSELGRRATMQDIKTGFRTQLMRFHPDHNKDGEFDQDALTERTRLIIAAYRELRDPAKRAAYDRSL